MSKKDQNVENETQVRSTRSYDEKRVPSRLAADYTYFGWVRARNKLSADADRRIQGITLSPSQDAEYTEAIRRKRRFGLNPKLQELEKKYFSLLNSETVKKKKAGRGAGFFLTFGIIFLIISLAALVLTFLPKTPTSVAECAGQSNFNLTVSKISDAINNKLFYGNRYYVKEVDVQKFLGSDDKTLVSVSPEINATSIYCIDENGQLNNELLEEKIDSIKKDAQGNIPILKCEGIARGEDIAYRYYIYYDYGAPLGFLGNLLPISPIVWIAVVSIVPGILFLIIGSAQKKKKIRAANYVPSDSLQKIRAEARDVIKEMTEIDPSLMTKSQRHFYSWQKLMVSAINSSNIARNDNADLDDFDEELDF